MLLRQHPVEKTEYSWLVISNHEFTIPHALALVKGPDKKEAASLALGETAREESPKPQMISLNGNVIRVSLEQQHQETKAADNMPDQRPATNYQP